MANQVLVVLQFTTDTRFWTSGRRDVARKTEGQDGVADSFLVGLFHSLQHAGLSRRTLINAEPSISNNADHAGIIGSD